MSYDIVAIIVASIAVAVLIILSVLWLWVNKRKKSLVGKKSDVRNKSAEGKKKETSKNVTQYTGQERKGNQRLDGARVSHRREHPDRIAQEEAFRKIKNLEKEKSAHRQEFECKNRLQIVYSPCNGDIVSIAGSVEEAKKIGLKNPGIVMLPGDMRISSPIDGIIKEVYGEEAEILLESKRGMFVRLVVDPKEKNEMNWMINATKGSNVRVGDELFRIADIRKESNSSYKLSVTLENYKKDQLLLIRKENYVTAGDKLMTIKEEMFT